YWITRDKFRETGKFLLGSHYTEGSSGEELEAYVALGTPADADDLEYWAEYAGDLIHGKEYVGNLKGYHYISGGDDDIVLFVSQNGQDIVQYSNWS
ncbi:MAG: hypothetical protein LBS89_05670, partial [Zoogloeaceae bacterium]|nr:hypothetical protein [Zoogloeaceae bacterium]